MNRKVSKFLQTACLYGASLNTSLWCFFKHVSMMTIATRRVNKLKRSYSISRAPSHLSASATPLMSASCFTSWLRLTSWLRVALRVDYDLQDDFIFTRWLHFYEFLTGNRRFFCSRRTSSFCSRRTSSSEVDSATGCPQGPLLPFRVQKAYFTRTRKSASSDFLQNFLKGTLMSARGKLRPSRLNSWCRLRHG